MALVSKKGKAAQTSLASQRSRWSSEHPHILLSLADHSQNHDDHVIIILQQDHQALQRNFQLSMLVALRTAVHSISQAACMSPRQPP